MAILSLSQIEELIRKPKASGILSDAEGIQDKYKLHISGENFEDTLKKIEGYESDAHNDIKKKHAQPTTKRIFEQILNQYKKVFRAQGFSRNYKFVDNNERFIQDFVNYLQNVNSGLSMWDMMQVVWLKAVFEESNGVFMVNLPAEASDGLPEPYPTFVPLSNIHDMVVNGLTIEYIIFVSDIIIKDRNGNDKRVKKYRVIDDAFDYNFIKDGDSVELAQVPRLNDDTGEVEMVDDIIENPWGYVPCIQPSTRYATLDNDTLKLNHVDQVIPNADNYLSISNSHTISVKLHQHPIFYSLPVTCPTCNGAGQYRKEDELIECTGCNSEGLVPFYRKDVSQGITLPEPDETSSGKAEAPCGYVTPDLESIQDQREEMRFEENSIEKGALGVEGILLNKSKRETATGKEIDMQPLLDKLSGFSANGEIVEKFLVNAMGDVRYTTSRYLGSEINWGRKYFVRTEQMIEEEYGNAKKAGLPVSALKELLEELYFTKFDNNPKALTRSLLLLELEPFPTYTLKEVVELDLANEVDMTIKQYFADFIERFEIQNGNVVTFMAESSSYRKFEVIREELIKMAEEKIEQGSESNQEEAGEELKNTIEGVKGIREILESINLGTITPEQARVLLLEIYKFPENVADQLINVEIDEDDE